MLDREAINRELIEIERERISILEKKIAHKKKHGAQYFKPFPYQQKIIDYLHEGYKIVFHQGSNQTGKTHEGCCLVDSFCRGVQAWDGKPSIFKGMPTKGRIIGSGWENHIQSSIIPKLKSTLFINEYETKTNNQGVEAFWKHKKTGSEFTIMVHGQNIDAFESDTFHWLWEDEPCPQNIHNASMRGLVANDGVCLMTFTSLKQAWIYKKIYQQQNNPHLKIAGVSGTSMRENKSLTEEAIKRYEEGLDKEEREARIYGGWLQLSGLVWPQFKRDLHVIKPFKIPPDWPVVVMIDPHWSMEFVLNYFTVSPMGKRYMIFEQWLRPDPKEVANEIVRQKKVNGWRLERCYIDPLAKGDTEITQNRFGPVDDVFTTIKKGLNPFMILLDEAKRSRQYRLSGIININTWLMEEWGEPTFFVFDICPKAIEQIETWGKGLNGEPIDEDDHSCENLHRFSLTNTRWTEIIKPIKYEQMAGVI